MERIIEKNKTYRIPRKDGSTDLYRVLLILGDSLKVKDLQKDIIKILNKSDFQKNLDSGNIYVAADTTNQVLSALKKVMDF